MDQSDVSYKAYKAWQDKLQEQDAFEEKHRQSKQSDEAKHEELTNRFGELQSRVDRELSLMDGFLQELTVNRKASPVRHSDEDQVSLFYHKLETLMLDADQVLMQERGRLALAAEEAERAFKKERRHYEKSVEKLRKAYVRTLD